jgi:hypothetical protein
MIHHQQLRRVSNAIKRREPAQAIDKEDRGGFKMGDRVHIREDVRVARDPFDVRLCWGIESLPTTVDVQSEEDCLVGGLLDFSSQQKENQLYVQISDGRVPVENPPTVENPPLR